MCEWESCVDLWALSPGSECFPRAGKLCFGAAIKHRLQRPSKRHLPLSASPVVGQDYSQNSADSLINGGLCQGPTPHYIFTLTYTPSFSLRQLLCAGPVTTGACRFVKDKSPLWVENSLKAPRDIFVWTAAGKLNSKRIWPSIARLPVCVCVRGRFGEVMMSGVTS